MKKALRRVNSWLDKVPKKTYQYTMLLLQLFMIAILCISISARITQQDALDKIHDTYVQATRGCMPITCKQTWEIGEIHEIAIAGLPEKEKRFVEYEIQKINESYYEYQYSLHKDYNGLFAPNDDPGPGVYADNSVKKDDNGWMADIPSAWTPSIN